MMNLAVQVVLLMGILGVVSQGAAADAATLDQGFTSPPASVKPSVYWYWLSDNISQQGVQRDIESMARLGIGRAFIGNIGLSASETSYGDVKLFSESWWDITAQAIKSATEQGVDIGLFNSPGWSQSGGPWIKPSQSMRYLAGAELRVSGPQRLQQRIEPPTADFQDVTVLAFPVPRLDGVTLAAWSPTIRVNGPVDNAVALADGKTDTPVLLPAGASDVVIDLETDQPFTARSLVLTPAQMPFIAQCELSVRQGDGWVSVTRFECNRSNPARNVGFLPYGPVAKSFAAVTGRHYRLQLTQIQNRAGLAEIGLSTAPQLDRYIEKQLAKMFPTPLPLWKEYQWAAQADAEDKTFAIAPDQVQDISRSLSPEGTLTWDVPEGDWIVLRLGMASTGVTNAPASPQGTGLEVDKLNRTAVEAHFEAYLGQIRRRLVPQDRQAWKYVVADSYETGSQNWTDDMAEQFRRRMGYDPIPWLPVLTGRLVGNADQSDRFLWDLRRLVADLVATEYVGGLREVSHRHGLKLWLENYGHWGYPSEFLTYGGQSDEVAGEFWNEGDLGSIECRAASSAAHIYGKTKVGAESFTAGGRAFQRYPALLKKRGDWSFTEGINDTLLHVYVTQPYENRNPGVNAGFGTEFNRKNTWFDMARPFVDYIRRCNYMLQQGRAVSDVAYFIGEDAPKMTGIRDPELPRGYSFDYINAQVILERMSVKDGRWVLPDGMSYRLLVLPQLATMRPELLQKLYDLVQAGAAILGPAPQRSPSLQNYPHADAEVKRLARKLWSGAAEHRVGQGVVFSGIDLTAALDALGVLPDCRISGDIPVLYTHRTLADGELYFVSNQSDQSVDVTPDFRVTGRQPEWWDAVTGSRRDLPDFTLSPGTTRVPLRLEAFQSGFVVFRRSVQSLAKRPNFSEGEVLLEAAGPWQVSFDPAGRGPVRPVTFDTLQDWTRHPDESVKYYAGQATYRAPLEVGTLPEAGRLVLDLGWVRAMARVTINGHDAGVAWTAPWQVEVTDWVKEGKNDLEITVVNTWVNRLIGDQRLPESQRQTWTNVNPYGPDSPLEPSGLIGPVRLLSVSY